MSSAKLLLALAVLGGCGDESFGQQGLDISIATASGPLAPGEYVIDVVLDEEHSAIVCTAGPAGGEGCEVVPGPEKSRRHVISAHAFMTGEALIVRVGSDFMDCAPLESWPRHASVTVRRYGEVLVAEAWAPEYEGGRSETCRRVYHSDREFVID